VELGILVGRRGYGHGNGTPLVKGLFIGQRLRVFMLKRLRSSLPFHFLS